MFNNPLFYLQSEDTNTLKSYIKIYGPPVLKAIKALEMIAVDLPEVCIMDTSIAVRRARPRDEDVSAYFGGLSVIKAERCSNIISKSSESLGEYDFFYEWFVKPSMDQLNDLIDKIDATLKPLGCMYTITTKQ